MSAARSDARTTPRPPRAAMVEHPADGSDQPPARPTSRLLLDPVFGPYFFGKLLSTAGVWVFNIVAAIIAWDLSHSTLVVGAVSVALFVPQLLFAPISGAQADRGDPKAQLLVGRSLIAFGSGALAVATWLVGVDGLPGAWPVVAAAAVTGLGFVVGGPAMHSLLPTLVRPSELSQAVALNSLPPTIARAGGPVLGAALLVTAGPAAAFVFTSVTNLVFGLVILWLPLNGRVERARGSDGTVRVGLAWLRDDPVTAFLIVGMLAVGLGADPIVTLTPALSAGFGHGETLVGVFASAFGVGAGLGYFAIQPVRRRFGADRLGTAGMALLGLSMLATGLAPTVAVAVVALGVGGVGFSWSLTGMTTRLYERVPETLRGRVMALWSIAFLGSRPIGAALSGAVADATTVGVAFVVVAAAVAVLAAVSTMGPAWAARSRQHSVAGVDVG